MKGSRACGGALRLSAAAFIGAEEVFAVYNDSYNLQRLHIPPSYCAFSFKSSTHCHGIHRHRQNAASLCPGTWVRLLCAIYCVLSSHQQAMGQSDTLRADGKGLEEEAP